MQRIPTLLQKLNELSEQGDKNTIIEVDLMLDYTRVLYADLLEWRKKAAIKIPVIHEPTLAEMAEAMKEPEPVEEATNLPQATQITTPVFIEKKTGTQKDIRNSIGINDKFLYMSELFNNDKNAYENALDEINELENYQQAYNWLQTQYYWDEGEETTQSFYNMLSIFFSER